MFNLIPFKAEHSLMLMDHNGYIETPEAAVRKELNGPAFSAILNNTVIGCGGVILADKGFGVGWALLSKDILKYQLRLTRTVKFILNDIVYSHKLRRVEIVVLAIDDVALKWAKSLGFQTECDCGQGSCVARNYTAHGDSVIRMELVRDYA